MTPLARRRLLWALPFLVFVLLVGLFAAGLQRDPRALPSQRVGQPARLSACQGWTTRRSALRRPT